MFESSVDTARTAQQIPAATGRGGEKPRRTKQLRIKRHDRGAEKGVVVGLENLELWTRESSRAESIMSSAAPSSTQSGNHILRNHRHNFVEILRSERCKSMYSFYAAQHLPAEEARLASGRRSP